MGVLERLEEQRRYEIHQRKLGHAKPVIKTRDGGPALLKKFDPDSMATAARAHRCLLGSAKRTRGVLAGAH